MAIRDCDMNVGYDLPNQRYNYSTKKEDVANSFILSNNKGDFYHQGVDGPTTKFNGFTYCDSKTLEMYKILDELKLDIGKPQNIIQKGYKVIKEYGEKEFSNVSYKVDENNKQDEDFGEKGELFYDEHGELKEKVNSTHLDIPKTCTYLGPTGGIYYKVENYKGELTIDLDMRKHDDFDTIGRYYNCYLQGSNLIVEYKKLNDEGEEYKLYFGINLPNDNYELIQDWIQKDYQYSKLRDSLHKWYVYSLVKFEIDSNEKFFIAAGLSQKEVEDQIYLLKNHYEELIRFDREIQNELLKEPQFANPLPHDVYVGYQQSISSMYKMLSKNLEGLIEEGSFAGYPWFHQIWTRDELVSLRGYLELEDYKLVISKIFDYLEEISKDTGELPRIHKKNSLYSVDGVFWLAKRVEDLIFELDGKGVLSKYLSLGDIEYIYTNLKKSFSNIIKNNWDNEKELLYAKNGDSWMDTTSGGYLLDIQVQLLGFSSTLGVLAGIINNREEENHYLELEDLIKNKIVESFLDSKKLFNDIEKTTFNSNVFLAYYFYPQLLSKKQWEEIMDKALAEMKLSWGGISSLSKKNENYLDEYSGENNLSYHRGDSWYWINNIAGIVLKDLNEKKYRTTINSILQASTTDILKQGAFGYASEVSSAKRQEARGCLAQLWSISTYIELVHHLFDE